MIEFIDNPLEQTTAATDAVLAVLCFGCAGSIRRLRTANSFKAGVWSAAFLALAVASLLGAVVHGLKLPAATIRLIWHPLNLALGLTLALFVTGAVLDKWGLAPARRVLPMMLGAACVYLAATLFVKESFYLFLPFAGVCLVFALAVYIWLVVRRQQPGAVLIAAGIATTMIAAAVQASRGVSLTLFWQFDHRGIFHIIQMSSVLLLAAGVRRELRTGDSSSYKD